MNLIPDLEWSVVALHIRDLLYAYILALPIGWDREKSERTAGLRTFPLVAVAACGYMLVGLREPLNKSKTSLRDLKRASARRTSQ